jgi:hypothetical protein
LRGGRWRHPIRHPVRLSRLIGCGHMDFVLALCGLTFVTVTGCRIIRDMHHVLGRGLVVGVAPAPLVIVDKLVLHPQAPQACYGRMLPQCCRSLRGRDPLPPLPPIRAKVPDQTLSFTVRFGEAILCQTRPIPGISGLRHALPQPLGGHCTQARQGLAQRCTHTLQTVEGARCRLDGR